MLRRGGGGKGTLFAAATALGALIRWRLGSVGGGGSFAVLVLVLVPLSERRRFGFLGIGGAGLRRVCRSTWVGGDDVVAVEEVETLRDRCASCVPS